LFDDEGGAMGATVEVTTRREGVAEILLCRPDLLNRFDRELHRDLTETLRSLRDDKSVRAIVLASSGSAFSAGGDFALMRAANSDASVRRAIVDDARALLDVFLDMPQPIIAAVQGAAIGLGATVVLACDAVVAARSATLADTHVAVGLVAGDGGCLVWPASAGMLRARRHLLTGDPLSAEAGYQLGLVTDLVDEADQVRPEAMRLALRIAGLAPLAVQGTKRALNQLSRQRAGEVVDLALAYEEMTLGTADLREGVEAFAERRKPEFAGE
jgi:enoyl-CoA hydratase